MKIAVTGGTGFIGSYVVPALLKAGAVVTVIGTDEKKAAAKEWFSRVDFIALDINKKERNEDLMRRIAASDKLVHLAWSGLPNYKDLFHFEEVLPAQYDFLKALVTLGLTDITVTGTCFEYGMKEGALSAGMVTDPQNPYALAKDTLRKFLQQLQAKHTFKLKWLRLFYMYGKGQSEKSILSQLEAALNRGDTSFNMSGGEQVRDYLPVKEVAAQIAAQAVSDANGISNVCSGVPVTINDLVNDYLQSKQKTIELNKGFYPYPDYEAMAFWGIQ